MKPLDLVLVIRLAALGVGLGALATVIAPVAPLQIEPNPATQRQFAEADRATAGTGEAFPQIPSTFTLLDPPVRASVGTGQIDTTNLRVFGVAITPLRRAALIGAPGEAPAWSAEGETSHGLTIIAVNINAVVLGAAGGNTTELRVFAKPSPAPATPTLTAGAH